MEGKTRVEGGRGAVYIFVASPGPRKSAVAIGTFALRWLALTRYVVIKMSYPPALEGWHNCVQTQSLLHSYREPNRLPYIMGCKICFFFPSPYYCFCQETVAGTHFPRYRKKMMLDGMRWT